eukprot:3838521-Pyramimonas_sp.AAC.1
MPALAASDWSVVRICPRLLRPIGPSYESIRASDVLLVHRTNRSALPVSDWTVVKIYPRFLRPICSPAGRGRRRPPPRSWPPSGAAPEGRCAGGVGTR